MHIKFNNILIFAFVLFFFLPGYKSGAQNPGFQGKKALIEYNFNYMLAFHQPNARGRYVGNGFGLNTSHRLNLSYAFSRRSLVGLNFDHFTTGLDLPGNEINLHFDRLQVNTFGLHFNRYVMKKGALAPFGFYWKTGVNLIHAATTNYPEAIKVKTISNNIGLGIRSVYFKRLVLHFSGQISWVWGYKFQNSSPEDFPGMVQNRIKGRLLNHYLFENSIGVGFLF